MQILTYTTNENAPEKYTFIRSEIQNGDLILYEGTSFLSESIKFFDRAFYTHVGVAWLPKDIDRVLTIDMIAGGMDCVPLSRRMVGYKNFCILRPKVSKEKVGSAINQSLTEWSGRPMSYDLWLLLRIAIEKRTGVDLPFLGNKFKFVCSEFAQYYCDLLGLETYSELDLISPEDFRRFIDDNFELLYDDAPAPIFHSL